MYETAERMIYKGGSTGKQKATTVRSGSEEEANDKVKEKNVDHGSKTRMKTEQGSKPKERLRSTNRGCSCDLSHHYLIPYQGGTTIRLWICIAFKDDPE